MYRLCKQLGGGSAGGYQLFESVVDILAMLLSIDFGIDYWINVLYEKMTGNCAQRSTLTLLRVTLLKEIPLFFTNIGVASLSMLMYDRYLALCHPEDYVKASSAKSSLRRLNVEN